jgi:hypothetical protein
MLNVVIDDTVLTPVNMYWSILVIALSMVDTDSTLQAEREEAQQRFSKGGAGRKAQQGVPNR